MLKRFLLLLLLLAAGRLPAAEALPPAESVLQLILTNAHRAAPNDRAFNRSYSYVRIVSQVEKNLKGEEKDRSLKITTNSPALHAKTTNTPVVLKDADGNGQQARPHRKTDNNPGAKGGQRKREFTVDPELLARFEFSVLSSETIEGRPALLLEFKPKPDLPARDINERFLSHIAGRAWVDEAEGTVVRLQFHLLGAIEIVGGLAGAVNSFEFESERVRTAEGLWFNRNTRWKLQSRQLLARKITEFSEVRTNLVHLPRP